MLQDIYNRSPTWLQEAFFNAYAVKVHVHRYGKPFLAALDQLRDQESWTAARIEAYQNERLRELVRFAYDRSHYYREVMSNAGLGPEDIQSVRDLPRIPVLTREVLREQFTRILTRARQGVGWLHGHTSGTTGSPLSLWYDRATCVMTNAVDARQKLWAGKAPGDWIGLLLGRVIVPPDQDGPPFWRSNRIGRQVWFSSFHLTDANLPIYADEIERRRLEYLEGYPSTLFIFAKYLVQTGRRLPMRAVFTSSETLHDVQRETIEAAFECTVFDFYGHAERTIFASQCEAGEKHIAEEYGYVEVVDANGTPVADGELGYLTGTSLHNHAMPLIRYRTGDVSAIVPGSCACGRRSRRIRNVTTKQEDIVLTPEGKLISPSVLTHPFKPFPQILKSQIIQEDMHNVLVKIVPSRDFLPEHQTELLSGLQRRLGPGMAVRIAEVEDIPRDPSGKFRWVVSRVDHTYRI